MPKIERVSSLQTFWTFLLCLHENIQMAAYSSMERETRLVLVESFVDRDRDSILVRDKLGLDSGNTKGVSFEEIISSSQGFLEEDKNLKFLDVENQRIGCRNLELYKNSEQEVMDFNEKIITPLHKIKFAKQNFTNGSCLTCTRDTNKFQIHNEITVLKSKNIAQPKCIFYAPENRNKQEINVFLTARYSRGIVYVSEVEVVSTSNIEAKIKMDMIARGISGDQISQFIKSWNVDHSLRDSWIQINGLNRTNRENSGVFALMEKRGYSSLIENRNQTNLRGMPKLLHILSEVLGVVCSGWNPLRISSVSNVLRRNVNDGDSLDMVRTKVPMDAEASSEYWPLRKISLSPSTMEHLLSNAQSVQTINPSVRVNQFAEDSDMDNQSARLYLDRIGLWRC